RVGEVGKPSPDEHLIGAAADLVLELIVSGGIDLDVQADLAPGRGQELELEVRRRRRRRGVEAQLQARLCSRVDAVAVAGVGEDLPGAGDVILAKGVLVAGIVAENPRRQRRLRLDAAAVEKKLQILMAIDGQAHGLAKLAAALA